MRMLLERRRCGYTGGERGGNGRARVECGEIWTGIWCSTVALGQFMGGSVAGSVEIRGGVLGRGETTEHVVWVACDLGVAGRPIGVNTDGVPAMDRIVRVL